MGMEEGMRWLGILLLGLVIMEQVHCLHLDHLTKGSELGGTADRIPPSNYIKDTQKRNFDEIDYSGFDGFVKRAFEKRNFDEIDRSGFYGFVKRNYEGSVESPKRKK